MDVLQIIPRSEFTRIIDANIDVYGRLELFATMIRLNTLVEVKKAGSGHLGSSFSITDILSWLYLQVLNIRQVGINDPDRDIYFSSKGHDVPALYAVLFALGIIPEEKFLKLRRLEGLDGHPEASIPGVEASSGSLGMGISKGRGITWGKRYLSRKGRVFVVIGDGEMQEGQIWEGLQNSAHYNMDLTVIVDHNKIQTDMPVKEIIDLTNLENKFLAFGWHVERCNGHDFRQIDGALGALSEISGKPKVLIADTVKGCGVSFMERISDMPSREGKYLWHSGAPGDDDFLNGFHEIFDRIMNLSAEIGIPPPKLRPVQMEKKHGSSVTREYVASAYGEELLKIAETHPEIIVLDSDLSADCRLRDFEASHRDRFIECGIAEQDMVSAAGGLARQGLIPVVNSFASFLAARANEQIYNNACEGSKIIYVCHFAGMIPAGPGKSHQSIRDIALFGSIPGITIFQPANSNECRLALGYFVKDAKHNCMLRLNIGPSPRGIELPADYEFSEGVGTILREGGDALIISYGAVMLNEALLASELVESAGFGLSVVNMPWLNRFNREWLEKIVSPHSSIYVLEDHLRVGGLGNHLLMAMMENDLLGTRKFHCFGLDGFPACGTPSEVLRHHKLDGYSLANQILIEHGEGKSELSIETSKIFDALESAQ